MKPQGHSCTDPSEQRFLTPTANPSLSPIVSIVRPWLGLLSTVARFDPLSHYPEPPRAAELGPLRLKSHQAAGASPERTLLPLHRFSW
jgi:hypothetical protein